MPAFEAREGMPYWLDLATSDPQKSAYFYSRLLGWEVGHDAYRVARKDGLPVAGVIPQERGAARWITYFLGGEAEIQAERVEHLGGTVLGTAEVSLGRMTICRDVAGGIFGLMAPAGEEQFVAAGEPGVPVWHEYVAPSTEAIDFYGELFDWEIERTDGYYTALIDGAAFLGMSLVDAAPAGAWHTYFGVESIEAAASQVAQFGGTLIDGPVTSPFGPLAVVEDPTGAGLFLCEVEPPVGEDVFEADSILDV